MLSLRDIPLLRLRLDGQDLPGGEPAAIAALHIQNAMNAPGLCEITLTTDSFSTPFTIGRQISLALASDRAQIFSGTITTVTLERSGDGTRSLRLRAHDPLDALRHRHAPQSFTDMSTRDIAARLAADHGLALAPGQDGPRWPHLMQIDRSDLSMLRLVCARSGMWFCWRDAALHLLPLVPASAAATPPPRALPLDDRLLRFSLTTNALAHHASVETEGWDSATGTLLRTTTASDLGLRLAAAPPRARTEPQTGAPDRAALAAGAAARQHRRDMAAHGLDATFFGPLDIDLGTRVVLRDDDTALNDPCAVTTLTHTLDAEQGFLTRIGTLPPDDATGVQDAPAPLVHPATVISVADPDRLGRVQVTLDAAAGVQSGWLRVVLPAAGPDKGLIALPDVGDRVVLLQTGPTPEQALVIGGLIGPARRDMGVDGRAVKQYLFTTPDGQKLVLDDADHSALITARDGATIRLAPNETRIESANGSFVSFGKSETVLHSQTNLTLRAPGRDMVIGAASVDFKKL